MVANNGGVQVSMKDAQSKGKIKGSPYAIINNPSLKKAKKILAVLTSL